MKMLELFGVGCLLGFLAGWGIATSANKQSARETDWCQKCRREGAI